MIKRDKFGSIGQHNNIDTEYLDMGDSARSAGMMALSGSVLDMRLIEYYITDDGFGMRCPNAGEYSDTRSFTRDQLIPLTAGAHKQLQSTQLVKNPTLKRRLTKLVLRHILRGFRCQNTHTIDLKPKPWYKVDPLSPSHIGHLILCAKIYTLYPLLILSYPWLILDLIWSTKIKPYEEQNQVIAMLSVAGDWLLKLYVKMHPDYKKATMDYWGNSNKFRFQEEIGYKIICNIEDKSKVYSE